MRNALILPVLATLLFTACDEDGDPAAPGTTASVRFFNATTGLTGSGGFTSDGKFATGSVLAFGQSTQACSTLSAGSTSFGFGAANAAGTSLSGSPLTTLNYQSITAGGNFTVAAAGPATSPTLLLLDNNFPGSLAANQAAVRFVNLAPGTGKPFNIFTGTLGAGGTLIATNVDVGAPTPFRTAAGGSNAFTILHGHDIVLVGSAATLNLQAGTVNTVAIVPNAAAGGFLLINLPGC